MAKMKINENENNQYQMAKMAKNMANENGEIMAKARKRKRRRKAWRKA
jgi:hypothetical protein